MKRRREFGVSAWLGAGALSVGVSAAVLGGAAVAHADAGDANTDRAPRAASAARTAGPSGNTPRAPRDAASRRSARPTRAADPTLPVPAATVTALAPGKQAGGAGAAASAVSTHGKTLGQPGLRQPGPLITLLISDGTATHPDAGLIFGDGFSFTSLSCSNSTQCDGGRGGVLVGNGGSGYNGGNGGRAGIFGNGGTGGAGNPNFGSGGNGGAAGFFGNGGSGGAAWFRTNDATGGAGGRGGFFLGNGGNGGNAASFADGGDGGRGGLFFGVGGRGGAAGPGSVACAGNTCTVTNMGGDPGTGGRGGLVFGRAGKEGFGILPLNAPQYNGYTAVYPVVATSGPHQGEQEIGTDGTTINGNYPSPYYVPGTQVNNVQLAAGTAFARWGGSTGSFLAPDGTKFSEVVLAPYSQVLPYAEYVIKDPAKLPPAVTIEQSVVAPWYGQPGGGIQYRFLFAGTTNDVPVEYLINAGYLAYK